MERKDVTAKLILTADWHIRSDIPVCRTDGSDYLAKQRQKREMIFSLATERDIPIIIAGDIGNKPEWDNWLLSSFIMGAMQHKKLRILAIPGQHDLPGHRLDRSHMAGLGVLSMAGIVNLLCLPPTNSVLYGNMQIDAMPYGADPPPFKRDTRAKYFVLVAHRLVTGDKHIPGGTHALDFIRDHVDYDLIVTGDNHQTFQYHDGKTLLVNPGSLMRMSADQINHKPGVFLWSPEWEEAKFFGIKVDPSDVSREHIEIKEEKEARLLAFVERLKGVGEMKFSFQRTLATFLEENEVRESVRHKIWEVVDANSRRVARSEGEDSGGGEGTVLH